MPQRDAAVAAGGPPEQRPPQNDDIGRPGANDDGQVTKHVSIDQFHLPFVMRVFHLRCGNALGQHMNVRPS